MKRLLAAALLGLFSFANAQTIETTPNQITSGPTHTWSGVNTGTLPGNYMPGGPLPLYDPATNTISFSYGQATAAQTFAINQALQNSGSGITVRGYSYSWDIRNMNGDNRQGGTDTLTATVNTYNGNNTAIRRTDSWTYNTKIDWSTFSGIINYNNPGPTSDFGNLTVQFSGKDGGFWAGYFGPQVRNVEIGLRYTVDPCVTNPLSSTSCSGYAAAYLTQQCSINTLYDSSCPGYAQALFTQQCNINQLSDPACPGYAVAYLNYQCSLNSLYSTTCSGYSAAMAQCNVNPLINSMCPAHQTATTECSANPLYSSYCPGYTTATAQCSADPLYASYCPGYAFAYSCSQDGLYSNQCPNYAEAYAKKNILNIGSTTSSPNTNSSTIVLSQTSDPVAQAAPLVSDPVVNSIVTTRSTATTSETNPAAVVKLTAPAATTASPAPVEEKKSDSKTDTAQSAKAEDKPAGKPQTAREQLAEQRREAARKEAVAKGKDLANDIGKAADMQAQMEVQNVVIQAMGYSPGFDNYGRFILPDGIGYRPYTIYNNQRTVDTPAGRGLFGGSDSVHQRMVDSQYNLGN